MLVLQNNFSIMPSRCETPQILNSDVISIHLQVYIFIHCKFLIFNFRGPFCKPLFSEKVSSLKIVIIIIINNIIQPSPINSEDV